MIPTNLSFATWNHDICGTHSDNLRSNEGEGGLRNHTPPPDESAGSSGNVIVLDKWTGVFPVAEADPEMVSNLGK